MPSTTVDYEQGVTSYLITLIEGMLAALNGDLAAKVVGVAAPVFQSHVGKFVGEGGNWVTVSYLSETSARIGNNQKKITLWFQVFAQIDNVGNDTSANYEMTKQVLAAHLRTIFYDDALVQTPKIDAGLIGVVNAKEGECGPILPTAYRLADKVTTLRGLQLTYQVSFVLQTR